MGKKRPSQFTKVAQLLPRARKTILPRTRKKHTAVKPTVLVRHTEGEREGSRKQRPRLSHGHVGAEEKNGRANSSKWPDYFRERGKQYLLPLTRKQQCTLQ